MSRPGSRFSAKLRIVAQVALSVALGGCQDSPFLRVANQHQASWVQAHGRYVLQAGGPDKARVDNGMTCVMCHAASRDSRGEVRRSQGGTSTCYSCHPQGPSGEPHRPDWLSTHGATVRQSGGYDLAVISAETLSLNERPCDQCHTAVALPDGAIPPSPGARSTCFTCHERGPAGSPHALDWLSGHQQAVYAAGGVERATITRIDLGLEAQPCGACHTTHRDAGGNVPPSPKAASTCFTCHEIRPDNAPHPAREIWISEHGQFVHDAGGVEQAFLDVSAASIPQSCGTCHATARSPDGRIPASPLAQSTCFSCHYGPTGFAGRNPRP